MRLFNEMGQRIKYKGQLSKGDIVRTVPKSVFYYTVVKVRGSTGTAEHNIKKPYMYPIQFKEGRGWLIHAIYGT